MILLLAISPSAPSRRLAGCGYRWLALSILILALDLLSKQLAVLHLAPHQPVTVVPGVFHWTLAYNTGAAFSFLHDTGDLARYGLSALAVVLTLGMTLWLCRLPPGHRLLGAGLALLIGGALGNLWDRVQLGYVVDFVDLSYRSWHWPAFNLADSAICLGAALLAIDTLFPSPSPAPADGAASAPPDTHDNP
jgi:signal peptidase II